MAPVVTLRYQEGNTAFQGRIGNVALNPLEQIINALTYDYEIADSTNSNVVLVKKRYYRANKNNIGFGIKSLKEEITKFPTNEFGTQIGGDDCRGHCGFLERYNTLAKIPQNLHKRVG